MRVEGVGKLTIGDGTQMQPNTVIICYKEITIGVGCQIADNVVLVDFDHDLTVREDILKVGKIKPINIGNYCWIGSNSVILKGVTLGDGCVVGAGSVVTKSFPGDVIIAGNPAKLIKKRKYD
jgi:acetyltransferase-like isoleucine patch superfamily enzyme